MPSGKMLKLLVIKRIVQEIVKLQCIGPTEEAQSDLLCDPECH